MKTLFTTRGSIEASIVTTVLESYAKRINNLLGESEDKDNIIAIDIAINSPSIKKVQIFSYSDQRYSQTLNQFFNDKSQSILLNETIKNHQDHELVPGKTPSHPYRKEVNYTVVDYAASDATHTSLKDWATFLSENDFSGSTMYFQSHYDHDSRDYKIAFFVTTSKQLTDDNFKKIWRSFQSDIKENVFSFLLEWQYGFLQSARDQALRAAISQVMARNASHNLGSHILNHLCSAETLSKYDALPDDIHKYKSQVELSVGERDGSTKELIKPSIFDHIAWFNEYLKTRMDYLGDITWGVPMMETKRRLYNDIFLGFDRVRLLLDHISGLANFEFEIRVFSNNEPLKGCQGEKDPILAIPNDLLGMQAFYNILENIIRNTAKHGKKSLTEKTTFTIRCFEHELELAENQKDREYFCIEVSDNLEIDDIQARVEEQNKKLATSILEEGTRLRSLDLGLIEMSASAAYLRGMDIAIVESKDFKFEDIDQSATDPSPKLTPVGKLPILRAINRDGCLGYQFYLRRPLEVLFVMEEKVNLGVNEKNLRAQGIYQIAFTGLRKELENGRIFHHRFVVFGNPKNLEEVKQYLTQLPKRILFQNPEKISEILTQNDASQIIEIVWLLRRESLKKKYSFSSFKIRNSPDEEEEWLAPNCYQIVLLDHGGKNWAEYRKPEYLKWISHLDPMGSAAQRQLPSFINKIEYYPSHIANNEIARTQLLESCLCKVVMIDERIQPDERNRDGNQNVEIQFHEVFDRIGVIMPKRGIVDLGHKNLQSIADKIKDFVDDEAKNLIPDEDFIVFHYSLLTRMFGQSHGDHNTKTEIDNYLSSLIGKARIVVTSGAGSIPGGLIHGVMFVNFSPLMNSISGIRSKYLATQILYSSRNLVKDHE